MSEIEKARVEIQLMAAEKETALVVATGDDYRAMIERRMNALKFALTALDQLRWRDVEKELPKYTGDYNAVCNVGSMLGGYTTVRTYRFERIPGREPKWYIPNRPDEVVSVTHWLPLPTPPEAK